MDIKCFGDGGQSHKCHLSASSLLALLVSLCCALSLSPAHISIWRESRLHDEGFTHSKNCTLYPPQLAHVCKRRELKRCMRAKIARATNTQEGYSGGEREKEMKEIQFSPREKCCTTEISIARAPGFVMQFIFIQSLSRQVLFGRRREQKLRARLCLSIMRASASKLALGAFCRFSRCLDDPFNLPPSL